MSTPLSILLVSGNDGILRPLREALERIGFEADVARSSKHARTALERSTPPTVLFVDSDLPDGKCGEVIGLAAHCANPARAIVIIEKVDYDLYLDAMDAGASDFVMPPFSGADIAFLLCSVLDRPRQPHQATALKEARHAVGYNTAAQWEMNLLKISVSNDCNPVIAVDGSLTAVWVKELERVWQGFLSDHQAHDVKLDLSGVTFIDADGQRLLKSILVQGANVQEPQPLVKYIVERMRAELRHTTFEKEH